MAKKEANPPLHWQEEKSWNNFPKFTKSPINHDQFENQFGKNLSYYQKIILKTIKP